MAVLTLRTDQVPAAGSVNSNRLYGYEVGGKLRYSHGKLPALAAAADITSTIELCRLPQGRVRMLPALSLLWCTAYGAARVLDIGWRAYYGSDGKTAVAESANGIKNDLDVSGALNAAAFDLTTPYIDFFSQASVDERDKGPMIFATIAGGTIPIAGTLEVLVAYLNL